MKGYSGIIRSTSVEWNGCQASAYSTIDTPLLNTLFVDYINYGGYPEVVFSD